MVRVRFAPSPTGPLHIGGIRTALFNYLFAKHHKGNLILRIEDTDQQRLVPLSEKHIYDSLEWCGIHIDESTIHEGVYKPYKQSERTHIYRKYINLLISTGHAYYAFDSIEDLEKQRTLSESKGEGFIYNHKNRLSLKNSLSLSNEDTEQYLNSGDYVIRFKTPENELLEIEDLIRGKITFQTSLLDDKVLFKSDGMPTYHLANIVDDHLMEITHVIRGEEWLSSYPLHHLIYKAFGWESPRFAHLPLILKPSGKGKLSKRDGDKLGIPVFIKNFYDESTGQTIKGYEEFGYLPESIINFLAFLGWSPSDTNKEIYNMEELIKDFSLERINPSGSKFDIDKLRWYNHQYLQKKNNSWLAAHYKNQLLAEKNVTIPLESAEKIVSLTKERAVLLNDFLDLGSYFIESPTEYNEASVKKCIYPDLKSTFEKFISLLNNTELTDLPQATKNCLSENQIPVGKFMQPLRIALTGDLKGVDIFEIISFIGKEEAGKRISAFLKTYLP